MFFIYWIVFVVFFFIFVLEVFNSNVIVFLILLLVNVFVIGSSCLVSFEEWKVIKCFSFFFIVFCIGFFLLCLFFNGERGIVRINVFFLVEGEWNNDCVDGLIVFGGLCILVRVFEKRDFYLIILLV